MELAYTRSGRGEPLVLIHGIGHRRGAWDAEIALLAKKFDVIAVDLPGFGDSPPLAGLVTAGALAESVRDQFPIWGIERPHVAGNSLGGLLALELAAAGQARSATAFSPAGFSGRIDRFQAWLMLQTARAISRGIPRPLHHLLAGPKVTRRLQLKTMYAHGDRLKRKAAATDSITFGRSPGFKATLPVVTRYRFTDQVGVPVTIAWGAKDRVYRHALSRTAAKRLPDALHVTLADVGHVPMGDVPEQVADIIVATASRTSG